MAPNLRAPIALRVGTTLTCQPDQRRFFGFPKKKSRKKRRNTPKTGAENSRSATLVSWEHLVLSCSIRTLSDWSIHRISPNRFLDMGMDPNWRMKHNWLITYIYIYFPKFPALTNAQKPYFFARTGSNLASECRPFARLELGGWVGGSLKKPLSLKVRPRSTRKPSAHYVKRQKFPKFPALTNAQKPYFFARTGSNLASECRPFARLELPPPLPRDRARSAPRSLFGPCFCT